MFFSGALTEEQTDAMYTAGLGVTTCEVGRWLTVGSPSGGGNGAALIFVHIPQGLPYGLLVQDMVRTSGNEVPLPRCTCRRLIARVCLPGGALFAVLFHAVGALGHTWHMDHARVDAHRSQLTRMAIRVAWAS